MISADMGFPKVNGKELEIMDSFLPMAMVLALSVLHLMSPSLSPRAPFDKLTIQ